MSWVLFVWIGYAGSHSVIVQHGPFNSEKDCQFVGEKMVQELSGNRSSGRFSCAPKDKST